MASSGSRYIKPAAVALPKPRKRVLTGLLVLGFFVPPLALYLDGASAANVFINFLVWGFVFFPAAWIHAWIYLFRSQDRRNMSRPMRYWLWVRNAEDKKPLGYAASTPQPEPEYMDSTLSKATIKTPLLDPPLDTSSGKS